MSAGRGLSARPLADRRAAPETVLAYGLAAGVLLALLLLVTGLVLLLLRGGPPLHELLQYPGSGFPRDLPGALSGSIALEPLALIQTGLLVLIGTPLVRVSLAGLLFCREREWLFALIALAVLAVLLWGWRGL